MLPTLASVKLSVSATIARCRILRILEVFMLKSSVAFVVAFV